MKKAKRNFFSREFKNLGKSFKIDKKFTYFYLRRVGIES